MTGTFASAAWLAWGGVIGLLVCTSLTLGWLRVWIGPLVCTALFVSISLATLIVVSGSGTTRGYGASVGGPPIPIDPQVLKYWAVCAVCQLLTIPVGFRPRQEKAGEPEASASEPGRDSP